MKDADRESVREWPKVRTIGFDGVLVSFAGHLSEPANRAALAFRAALEADAPDAVEETSTSLASCYIRFDPLYVPHEQMIATITERLGREDWYAARLRQGHRLWHIPCVFGTALAPQLDEAAEMAGMTPEAAIRSLAGAQCRVQALGFAPGQPYLGELPEEWNIPRQANLTGQVPEGALATAIRQFVMFSTSAPTGWRHVGQTATRLFRPEEAQAFLLHPGDEVRFVPVTPEELDNMRKAGPDGGARSEALP